MYFKYPYSNFHELNLDWLIAEINKIKKQIEDLPDLDEKIKELEEMLADLEATLARSLGMGIVDNSNFNLYAQILPDANSRFNGRMYAQGFCIGDHAGVPYATQTFIEIDEDDPLKPVVSQIITMTDMITGQRMITNVHTELEHANSITYVPPLDRYVIATAGKDTDLGKVVEIDKSGNTYMIHYLDAPMFAVAYNQDIIYTLGGNKLYKYDLEWNLIESVELDLQQGTFTYQGMAADDYFLYIFNGNTIPANTAEYNINRVSVFSHAGLPVKQVVMRYPLEIEEGDFLNGEFIISSNTTHAALLLKADLYARNRIHSFGEPLDNIDLNQNGIEIHVKEDYKDFLVDGSGDHPLSAITWLMLWLRNSTDRMNIKIDTDITQTPTLSFRRCPNTIFNIDGGGHFLPNLLFDGGTLFLNNAVLPGVNNKDTIDFFGSRIVLNNVKFGLDPDMTDPNNPIYDSTTPSRMITVTSSYEIDGITINQNTTSTGVLFYFLGSGYLRSVNIVYPRYNYYALVGQCIADSTFPLNNLRNQYRQTYKPGFALTSTATIDFTKLKFPCRFLRSGATITNLPAGENSSDIFLIDVELSGTVNTVVTIHHNDHTETTYFN